MQAVLLQKKLGSQNKRNKIVIKHLPGEYASTLLQDPLPPHRLMIIVLVLVSRVLIPHDHGLVGDSQRMLDIRIPPTAAAIVVILAGHHPCRR